LASKEANKVLKKYEYKSHDPLEEKNSRAVAGLYL